MGNQVVEECHYHPIRGKVKGVERWLFQDEEELCECEVTVDENECSIGPTTDGGG